MEPSTIFSIASLLLSAGSIIWIGGFRFSAIIHEIKTIKEDMNKLETRMEKGFERIDQRFEKVDQRFEKIETRLDRIENDLHKMDVRITVLEHRKP
jgi:predicted  nucleic acid-binding Zn-ribbon protein